MFSYSSQPSWIMVKDDAGNRVWVNMSKIDYAAENNKGWTMLNIGGNNLLVQVSFDRLEEILAGGD